MSWPLKKILIFKDPCNFHQLAEIKMAPTIVKVFIPIGPYIDLYNNLLHPLGKEKKTTV